jgi:hypothetical protein
MILIRRPEVPEPKARYARLSMRYGEGLEG